MLVIYLPTINYNVLSQLSTRCDKQQRNFSSQRIVKLSFLLEHAPGDTNDNHNNYANSYEIYRKLFPL